MSEVLTIRLLGPLSITANGVPLAHLRSRRGQWLLALLGLRQGRPVAREYLAETLWPDTTHEQALLYLRQTLTDLRRALGSAADRLSAPTPQTLCLELEGVSVDVARFDTLVADGSAGALEEAVDLYAGPLLEGCLEEWALRERAVRQEQFLTALEALAHSALSEHGEARPARAVHCLRRLVAADPLREDAHCALMQALAACGDHAAVRQAYRDLRLLLHSEINAEPSPETVALYERLVQQGRSVAAVPRAPAAGTAQVPRRLPVPLTRLVGRDGDVRDVVEVLRAERLVTLVGPGGVGKTRLAIAVGEALLADTGTGSDLCADGVWLVDLAPLTDASLVAHTVARALGVREEAGRGIAELLAVRLAQRRLLLILDNCEHLLAGSAQVAETLLGSGAGVRILATSRERLGLAGEHLWRVRPLAVPQEMASGIPGGGSDTPVEPLEGLAGMAGVRLFVERAQAVSPRFDLDAANAPLVARACRRLEGIPLAIELAAAHVRAVPLGEMADRLENGWRLRMHGSRVLAARHRSLENVLDWSCALLSEHERCLLARLSVFAGGWTLGAAEEVCAFGGIEPAQVLDLLESMVDKSLVTYEVAGASGRYGMLETVRQYAAERLAAPGGHCEAQDRHLEYFVRLAEQSASAPLEPAPRPSVLACEHPNIRAALTWSLSSGDRAGRGLALAATLRGWSSEGCVTEGRGWLKRLLAATHGETLTRMRGLNAAGTLAWLQGAYAEADTMLRGALRISRAAGEQLATAAILQQLWLLRYNEGDYAGARPLVQEALLLCRQCGDRRGEAAALSMLGTAEITDGHTEAAEALYEESLAIHREGGEEQGAAYTLNALGDVARARRDYATARARFTESLETFRRQHHLPGIGAALRSLGMLALQVGDLAGARVRLEENLRLSRDMGDRGATATALFYLGIVERDEGRLDSAADLLDESVELRRAVGQQAYYAWALCALGSVRMAQGRSADAIEGYAVALKVLRPLADGEGTARLLLQCAGLAAWRGAAASAASLLGASQAHRPAVALTVGGAWCDQRLAEARDSLGAAGWDRAVAAGHSLGVTEALALADEVISAARGIQGASRTA